jgi:folate-binding protein YgfZ
MADHLANDGNTKEEYRHARDGAVLFDVSNRGLVELRGPDAIPFLHNLCTNDIKNLAPDGGCEAFLTTAKAKVIARIIVAQVEIDTTKALWLDTAPQRSEKVRQHLDHYLVSEQVEITDRSAEFVHWFVAGPKAEQVLATTLGQGALPMTPLHHAWSSSTPAGRVLIRRQDLSVPGFDVICAPESATALAAKLVQQGARPAGPETFEVLRVEAGTPADGVDFDEERLVMELGRTRQAICYTKGCFLGQEPIVMARDRGHVNRTLLGVTVAGDAAPGHGTKVLRDGQEVGLLTSSVVSPRLGVIALAFLRRGHQEPGTRVVVDDHGTSREGAVAALPFVTA